MKKGSVKNRQVLTDEVYESIKSLLMDHVILPGARVSIDGLARELKVSQTPVREALARLEADELVVRKPLTGYSSTPVLTLKELLDLYDFRFMIEPRATELATKKLTVDGEKRLKSELAIGKKITSGSNYVSYRALTEHDARFHNLVLELSTNTFMESSFIKTHCHLHLFRLSPTSAANRILAVKEHGEIVKAMLSRDAQIARSTMLSHLVGSRERFLPYVLEMG
jgi:DNA-binding GntR family transcriptional regulator